MSYYFLILFIHITGAMGLFVGIGLECLIVWNLKNVTTHSQALQWTNLFKVLPPVFSISGILILASGIYMWAETWGDTAWIISGLCLFISLSVFGSVIMGKKVRSIAADLKSESGKLSEDILSKIKSPLITKSLHIRAALAVSVLFIMTIKPGWTGSIISVGVAVLAGTLFALIFNGKGNK